MAVIDISGQKFGRWTVLERAENTKDGSAQWLCECSCENHTRQIVRGSSLRSGHSQSCGCLKKEKAKEIGHKNSSNLIGQRFGQLIVLEKSFSKNYKIHWKCQCDCGNITYVPSDKLKSGHTTSCGCKTKSNIQGQKFDHLTAIEPTNQTGTDESIIWRCRCDCGNQVDIFKSVIQLKTNLNLSCGCSQKYKGEVIIAQLLTKANITYEQQKSFKDCRFPDSNRKAVFDFYVNNSYIIEYDGEQHFSYKNRGWNTQDKFKETQKRDNFKNNWCKEHNIPLIRIPYTHLDNIKIEDLLLTSNYIL